MSAICVHQIWIGPMPDGICGMVSNVRERCARQGVRYVMHGAEVLETHGTVDSRRALDRLRDFVPPNIWRVVVSDWGRWRVMAAGGEGTLYMDTDCVFTGRGVPSAALGALPDGLLCMPEGWAPDLTSSGCVFVKGSAGAQAAGLAGAMAGGRLEGLLDLPNDEMRAMWDGFLRGSRLVDFLGPGWLRSMVAPQAAGRGWRVGLMPQAVASCRMRDALIYHEGVGSWLRRG